MTKIMGVLLCICLLMGVFPLGTAHAAQKVEIVNATSELTEIARRAQAISDTLELLPATGSNRNGRVRLSGFTKSADGSKDMKDLKGKHYLIRNQDSVFYAVDGSWTGTDANLPLKVVTPSDTTIF